MTVSDPASSAAAVAAFVTVDAAVVVSAAAAAIHMIFHLFPARVPCLNILRYGETPDGDHILRWLRNVVHFFTACCWGFEALNTVVSRTLSVALAPVPCCQ